MEDSLGSWNRRRLMYPAAHHPRVYHVLACGLGQLDRPCFRKASIRHYAIGHCRRPRPIEAKFSICAMTVNEDVCRLDRLCEYMLV